MARRAKATDQLRKQLDAEFPNRSRLSDGWIGDAAHLARESFHNPDADGVVWAHDFTHDPAHGMDIDRLTDELAASGDSRILELIANGLYWHYSTRRWVPYTGANRHDKHFHITVKPGLLGDDPRPWDIPSLGADLTPDQDRILREVHLQLTNKWPQRVDITRDPKTLVDYARGIHAEVTAFIERREGANGGPLKDSTLGHAATAAGQVKRLSDEFEEFREATESKLAAILAAVTTTGTEVR